MEEQKKILTPYEWYRQRRPYCFSDTKITYKVELTKEIFQYDMDRLSNDMKQDQFENLTKSLVLRFITPNLIPQTGPTGGGDGKTDIETHPIADKITERWYITDSGCKGSEKWAIAISCKEDWKGKVVSDVKKILELNRNFTKILFFSNRLIRSKDRKQCEDDLYEKYKIQITIFDQNWFTDRVFDDKCINIAVKELELSQQYTEIREVGPMDLQRQKEQKEIENKILQNNVEYGLDTNYVDLMLDSALLSRKLEEAPSIIRGKFIRAEKAANLHGTKQQKYVIIYQRGWTEFYWLKNPDGTYECFQHLKLMLNEKINVDRIEKLINLFNILITASNLHLFIEERKMEEEFAYVKNIYKRLEKDKMHQSSFLYLRISLLEMKIIHSHENIEKTNKLLDELSVALNEAKKHIDISFESHCEIMEDIGKLFYDNEKYEDLIDHLTEILSSRQQDITAAEVQMNRGLQNLECKKYVQAIRHLGQCVELLGKEQTKGEYIKACGYLGTAFKHQDLLYAAKVMFMKSVSMLMHKIESTGSSDHLLITVLSELCELELRSGQIINFLLVCERRDILVRLSPDYEDEQFFQQRAQDESMLAVRLMSGSVDNEYYPMLPEILKRQGLSIPQDVLYYKLGYQNLISEEFQKHIQIDKNWTTSMRKLIEDDVFLFANSISAKNTHLETLISGCKITVDFDSDCLLQIYAELLLAFLESFASTASFKDFAFSTDHIHFTVKAEKGCKNEIKNDNNTSNYIFNINPDSIDDQEVWKALTIFFVSFFTQNVQTRDIKEMFYDKQEKEKFMSRLAVMMTYVNDIKCLYGDDFKNTIMKWSMLNDKIYKFQGVDDLSTPFEKNRGRQANQIIASIIDYSLWDNAHWSGCGYILTNNLSEPPFLLFLYRNMEYGKKIFEEWAELQKKRRLNIRISFVLHVDYIHPTWYRVQIGQDLKKLDFDDKRRYAIQTNRLHTMTPNTNENIELFKKLMNKFGCCKLSAMKINDNNQMDPKQRYEYAIPVKNIVFREAWEVGVDDEDSATILAEDKPIIPIEHLNDAPVLDLLKRKE